MTARLPLSAALLLALASGGCTLFAKNEPSPRGHSAWRPHLLVTVIAPAAAVLQGEGGPIDMQIVNAGFIPVKALDLEPEDAADDGSFFELNGAASPVLEPGDVAHATAVVRPEEAGDEVTRRFVVLYRDARVGRGGNELRRKTVEVKLQVAPASSSMEDARSKGKVESSAPGVYSSLLAGWGFARQDGVVFVPDESEPLAWKGLSLRAFAWADLFVGDAPLRCTSAHIYDALSIEGYLANKSGGYSEVVEDVVPEGTLPGFFGFAATSGFTVEAVNEGHGRRVLVVNAPEWPPAPTEPEKQ